MTRPDDHDEILGKAYDARLMARLWAVTRPHKRLVLVSLVLFPLTAAAELLQPYLIKVAIDHHILAGDWSGYAHCLARWRMVRSRDRHGLGL